MPDYKNGASIHLSPCNKKRVRSSFRADFISPLAYLIRIMRNKSTVARSIDSYMQKNAQRTHQETTERTAPKTTPEASPGTTLLLILDGWGYREATDNNAIALANTPVWDELWKNRPHALIHTSGLKVGLPDGQMGNSEVGHMNLGAGRVVYQNLTRINKAIEDGSFLHNIALNEACESIATNGKALHIIGLLSPGGIHSHEDHLLALIDLASAKGCSHIYLHALLDGRDTPPQSAAASLAKIETHGKAKIASLSGRFYAMDRDKRWDRVEKSFQAICHGQAKHHYQDAYSALNEAYDRKETDEFVIPTVIYDYNEAPTSMQDGDAVIFMNFRADRARELTHAFIDENFTSFDRGQMPKLASFTTLTEYSADLNTPCAFPPEKLKNTLGEYISTLNLSQLRIAETEKYAHVTFFFSGGREQEYTGESRILIPSPDVLTYDLKPEMSVFEVTDKLVEAITSGSHDLIICNFANGDMVGHTGILSAAMKAAQAVDLCLKRIQTAILESGGHCLITADHGNAEQMMDEVSGQPLTSHTTGPVPLIYLGSKSVNLEDGGALSDIAPSLLTLMELEQPAEMTGHSLIHIE